MVLNCVCHKSVGDLLCTQVVMERFHKVHRAQYLALKEWDAEHEQYLLDLKHALVLDKVSSGHRPPIHAGCCSRCHYPVLHHQSHQPCFVPLSRVRTLTMLLALQSRKAITGFLTEEQSEAAKLTRPVAPVPLQQLLHPSIHAPSLHD